MAKKVDHAKKGRGAVRHPKPFSAEEPRTIGWQTYRHANVIEEILSDDSTPADVRRVFIDAIMELSARSGVDVLHPRVVRDAYVEMVRCGTSEAREAVRDIEILIGETAFDPETGRSSGSSIRLQVERAHRRALRAVIGAAPVEHAEPRKRRKKHSFVNNFAELQISSVNRKDVDEMKYGLLTWVAFLLDICPGFIPFLYEAVTTQWCDRVRGVVYDRGGDDHRDRKSVRLHGIVLDALTRARGEVPVLETAPYRHRERGNGLADAETLFTTLASKAHELRTGAEALVVVENDGPACRVCAAADYHQLSCAFSGEVTDEQCAVAALDAPATPESESDELHDLRRRLASLERLPENEGVALQLESEIFKLESASIPDEWPDVIGGEG